MLDEVKRELGVIKESSRVQKILRMSSGDRKQVTLFLFSYTKMCISYVLISIKYWHSTPKHGPSESSIYLYLYLSPPPAPLRPINLLQYQYHHPPHLIFPMRFPDPSTEFLFPNTPFAFPLIKFMAPSIALYEEFPLMVLLSPLILLEWAPLFPFPFPFAPNIRDVNPLPPLLLSSGALPMISPLPALLTVKNPEWMRTAKAPRITPLIL